MNLGRARQRVDDGIEFREHGIPCVVHDAPVVPLDRGREEIEIASAHCAGRARWLSTAPHTGVGKRWRIEGARRLLTIQEDERMLAANARSGPWSDPGAARASPDARQDEFLRGTVWPSIRASKLAHGTR